MFGPESVPQSLARRGFQPALLRSRDDVAPSRQRERAELSGLLRSGDVRQPGEEERELLAALWAVKVIFVNPSL